MSRPVSMRVTCLGLLGAAALSLSAAAPALADNGVTTTVAAGSYAAWVTDVSLTGATLNFLDAETATGSITLNVEDARDTGAGWRVTVQSSDFTHAVENEETIGAELFAIGTPGSITAVGTGSQAVSGTVDQGPLVVGTGGSLDEAVEVIEANIGYGQGAYTQTLPATLSVPAGAITGVYNATLTVTISSGPDA